jgi:hypothetical protein
VRDCPSEWQGRLLSPESELLRLQMATVAGGAPTIAAHCEDPALVLDRVRSVLEALLDTSIAFDSAAANLPTRFVNSCAPFESQDDSERWLAWWRSLPADEQARAADDKPWTLEGWLFWMTPQHRTWHWLGASFDDKSLYIELEVNDWPTATGSLAWLLRASGAIQVDVP